MAIRSRSLKWRLRKSKPLFTPTRKASLAGRFFCAHSKNRVGEIPRGWHIARMTDYDRIATVIRYIDAHREEQPDLATLAAVVGLSPSRFHRLFGQWAGITPKAFLQCLTLEYARAALRRGESVLNASFEAGLSGPSRLHDLAVTLEAASPGEIKSGGAGWAITAGSADTPFGRCLIAKGPRGICHLSFADEWDRLSFDWPKATLVRDDAAAKRWVASIFLRTADSPIPPLKLFLRGTEFQVRVWRALLRIPAGTFTSYRTLAASLGKPNASRAVGTAVGQNAIGYLIPCHRVIRETGMLGGYRWGLERKRAMHAWEAP